MAVSTKHKISRLDRLYEDERGYDFIGHTKRWYAITAALLVGAIAAILIRGFTLSLDFEGGTTLSMPAGDLKEDEVATVFEDSTGVEPEQVRIVGAGDSETLEITSERLSQEEVDSARSAIYEEFQPKDENGEATPDAIGSSTVSESLLQRPSMWRCACKRSWRLLPSRRLLSMASSSPASTPSLGLKFLPPSSSVCSPS